MNDVLTLSRANAVVAMTFALVSAFVGACASGTSFQPTDSIVDLSVTPTSLSRIIDFDRIQISPTGDYLVGWLANAEELISGSIPTGAQMIAPVSCIGSENANCRAFLLTSSSRLQPPIWQSDEKSFYLPMRGLGLIEIKLVPGDHYLLIPGAREHFVERLPGRVLFRSSSASSFQGWRASQINSLLQFSVQLNSKARADQFRIRTISVGPNGVIGGVFERRDDLETFVIRSDLPDAVDINVKYPAFRPDVWLNEDGPVLRSLGWSSPLVNPRKFSVAKSGTTVPFSRPIFDTVTGRLIGDFDDRKIRVSPKCDISASAISNVQQKLEKNASLYLQSVSVVCSAHTLAALASTLTSQKLLVVARGRMTPQSVAFASSRPVVFNLSQPEEYSLRVSNLGTVDWPIWSHWYIGNGRRKGLVVYLHGGPNAADVEDDDVVAIQNYLHLGYDIVVPEYSGTNGVGLSVQQRLVLRGSDAVLKDAALLQEYLARSTRQYASRVLHADSYGAIYYLTQALGGSGTFDRVVLTSPFIKYRPGAASSSHEPGDANYQMKYERFVLGLGAGVDHPIDEWMDRQTQSVLKRAPTLVLRAEGDPVSQKGDFSVQNSLLREVSLANATHSDVQFTFEAWKEIQTFLRSD